MADLIAVVAIVLVLGAAIRYIIKSKKSGVRCIGCPSGGNCCSAKKGGSECSCSKDKN